MDQAGESPEGGGQAEQTGAPARGAGSGEGSRSALEQLIQQESKRRAHLPREAGTPEGPGAPPGD